MNFLVLLVLVALVWALATDRIRMPDNRQGVALALGAVGLVLLGRGKPVAAAGLLAAGAALWPWTRRLSTLPSMRVDEARALLGVPPDADAETIRAAHRRLIAQTHPDRGGTEELARRINLARDTALSAIGNSPETNGTDSNDR